VQTVDGGYLEVRPGGFTADLSAQYEHEAEDWDDEDVAALRVQIPDCQGDIWEALFRVQGRCIFDIVFSGPPKQYYADVSEDSRQAFRTRMLLQGLQTLDDSRECKGILIGEDLVEIHLKYQIPIMDVAWYEDGSGGSGCLRVRTFHVMDNRAGEIPPFVSTIPLMAFLLQIAEKTRENDEFRDAQVTEESRFHKVGHGERRQPNVVCSAR
jgi:hypothetical protein